MTDSFPDDGKLLTEEEMGEITGRWKKGGGNIIEAKQVLNEDLPRLIEDRKELQRRLNICKEALEEISHGKEFNGEHFEVSRMALKAKQALNKINFSLEDE